jgi:hypothetical protein
VDVEKIFEGMKIPHHAWSPTEEKVIGEYILTIDNCGDGYIDYEVTKDGKRIFYKNERAGDYETSLPEGDWHELLK